MISSFLKDGIVYSISSFLSKGVAFFLIPIFAAKLSVDEFGLIDYFIIIGSLANFLIGFEITQGLARFIADSKYKDQVVYSSTALWFSLVFYLIFICITLLFSDSINNIITGDRNWIRVYNLAMLSVIGYGLFYFFQSHLRWTFKVKENGILNIVYTLLCFGIASMLILFTGLGVEGYFIGTCIGGFVSALIAWYINRDYFKFSFSPKALKEMLSFSAPLIFSSAAVLLSTYMDRIMIKSMLDLTDLGIYGMAYRFAALASLLIIGFRSAITPLIYKHYGDLKTPSRISKIFKYFIVFCTIAISFLIFFSEELVGILTNSNYYESITIIPILAGAALLGNMYMFTPGMGIFKRTKWIAYISVTGLIINFLLNYFLIPIYGIMGASIATVSSAFFIFILYVICSQRLYFIPFNWGQFIRAIILIFVAYLFCDATSILLKDFSNVGLFLKILSYILICLVAVFVLIPFSEVKANFCKLKLFR